MDFINSNREENNKKTKKIMVGIAIAIAILLVISIILFVSIYYLENQQFKFIVNGNKVNFDEDLFLYDGEKVYVSIKDIAPIIDYNYYNGGYKEYTEDSSKCYLENENEICTFEKNSNILYKNEPEETDYEYYTIEDTIKGVNDKLYVSSEGLSIACNLKFYYNPEENKIAIYTLPYYASYYTTNYNISAVYDSFKNQKALLYGLMVVQNEDNTSKNTNNKNLKYGIYDITGEKPVEVVGTKYTNIEFIESTQEFIVETTEGKVGIITADGETKIQPQYDSLKQIDKNLNLYLATSNNKKGIIEKNGKILVYLEYDEIGIDASKFQNSNIKNSYILFGNAIPVKQNGKWGMYDIKGNLILPIEYNSIGCISSNKSLNSVAIISDIKAIVVSKEYEIDRRKTELYGIVNKNGNTILPTALEEVYSVINNGREEIYLTYQQTNYNAIEFIKQYGEKLALAE